jgi:hypothetical protein
MADEGTERATTPRDLQLLRFIGEMYGVPLAVFGDLVARYSPQRVRPESQATLARRHALRLERLGFAGRHRRLGRRWVFPTAQGLHQAGLPFGPAEPALWKLEHTAVVAKLRMYLERAYPGSAWESERWIRYRYRQAGIKGRIPDGLLAMPSGSQAAVEVELTRKGQSRYPDLFGESQVWDTTWWFVRSEADAAWLRARMAETVLPVRPIHEVHVLPEEVLTS